VNDLGVFLKARLDEVEEAARDARACAEVKDGRWFDGEDEINDDNGFRLATVNHPFVTTHIALHDPARTLRQVEADRRLLAKYEEFRQMAERQQADSGEVGLAIFAGRAVLSGLIQDRVAIYSDHPDYRQEWNEGMR
jgi:Family of unknown function (DUF6221)